MTSLRVLVSLCLLLLILTVYSGNGEIHRAVKHKHPIRTQDTTRRAVGQAEDEQMSKHSSETWILSLVSAGLVGLSGIFPLLVIPLEAGKALRRGGEND